MNYPGPMSQPIADDGWQQQRELNLLLQTATTGAIVGATGAAAVNLHKLRNDHTDWQTAAKQTAKAGLAAGTATAAATAVGRLFPRSPTLSLLATFATGTAVMYALTKGSAESKESNNE